MSITKDQAAALYAAVFTRAPDQMGLNYWLQQDSFSQMANAFVGHPVFQHHYGELDAAAFVNAIYENVLQGTGDAEGIAFWIDYLDQGASRGDFLAAFIDGALAYDGDDPAALARQAALQNQIEVGLYYTEQMGEYSNLSDDVDPNSIDVVDDPVYQQSQAVLEGVTSDPATVVAAKAMIDDIVPVDTDAIVEALQVYQVALDDVDNANQAEQDAAKAANDRLDLDQGDAPYDIEALTTAVAAEVEDRADTALERGKLGLDSLSLNEATIALIRENFNNQITTAQGKVDLLKAQNPAAVALQEKIEAYNSMAAEINRTELRFSAEQAKFGLLNQNKLYYDGVDLPFDLDSANDANEFSVTVDLAKEALYSGTVLLTVEKGQLVVKGYNPEGVEQMGTLIETLFEAEQNLDNAQAAVDAQNILNGTLATLIEEVDGAAAWIYEDSPTEDELATLDAQIQALTEALSEAGLTDSSIDQLSGLTLDSSLTAAALEEAVNGVDAYVQTQFSSTQLDALQTVINEAQKAVDAAEKSLNDPEVVKTFNQFDGVDEYKDQVKAMYDNIAKQAAAQKSLETALLTAFKEAGYAVYDNNDKVVSWSNVKWSSLSFDYDSLDAVDSAAFGLIAAKPGVFTVRDQDDNEIPLNEPLFATAQIDENSGTVEPDFDEEFTALNPYLVPTSILTAAAESSEAVKLVADLNTDSQLFEEALTDYTEAVDLQAALLEATGQVDAAAAALTEAEEAFEKFGVNLVKADDEGIATGEVYNEDNPDELADLFVYSESLTQVDNFDGPDLFFFGDKAAAFIVLPEDKDVSKGNLGGDASTLEIFALQDGTDTILYVEKAAFAGNASTPAADNGDLVTIVLTGVQADQLGLDNDGFLQIA